MDALHVQRGLRERTGSVEDEDALEPCAGVGCIRTTGLCTPLEISGEFYKNVKKRHSRASPVFPFLPSLLFCRTWGSNGRPLKLWLLSTTRLNA